jgi:hypothetical protein
MADARDKVHLIAFNTHASAAAVSLLPPPKFAIHELLIDLHTCRNTREDGDQSLSMGFASGAETEHKWSILQYMLAQL